MAGAEIRGLGGGGIHILVLHCHHQNDSALRWAAMLSVLMFH